MVKYLFLCIWLSKLLLTKTAIQARIATSTITHTHTRTHTHTHTHTHTRTEVLNYFPQSNFFVFKSNLQWPLQEFSNSLSFIVMFFLFKKKNDDDNIFNNNKHSNKKIYHSSNYNKQITNNSSILTKLSEKSRPKLFTRSHTSIQILHTKRKKRKKRSTLSINYFSFVSRLLLSS